MKTPKTIKNSEYRVVSAKVGWCVWLVSFATGAKLKKIYKHPFPSEDAANEFINWLNDRERKNQ